MKKWHLRRKLKTVKQLSWKKFLRTLRVMWKLWENLCWDLAMPTPALSPALGTWVRHIGIGAQDAALATVWRHKFKTFAVAHNIDLEFIEIKLLQKLNFLFKIHEVFHKSSQKSIFISFPLKKYIFNKFIYTIQLALYLFHHLPTLPTLNSSPLPLQPIIDIPFNMIKASRQTFFEMLCEKEWKKNFFTHCRIFFMCCVFARALMMTCMREPSSKITNWHTHTTQNFAHKNIVAIENENEAPEK